MIHLAYFNNIMYGSTEALWSFMKLILLASAPHRMKESTWSMEIKIISKYYLIWPQDRNLRNLLGLLYDDPKLLTGTMIYHLLWPVPLPSMASMWRQHRPSLCGHRPAQLGSPIFFTAGQAVTSLWLAACSLGCTNQAPQERHDLWVFFTSGWIFNFWYGCMGLGQELWYCDLSAGPFVTTAFIL